MKRRKKPKSSKIMSKGSKLIRHTMLQISLTFHHLQHRIQQQQRTPWRHFRRKLNRYRFQVLKQEKMEARSSIQQIKDKLTILKNMMLRICMKQNGLFRIQIISQQKKLSLNCIQACPRLRNSQSRREILWVIQNGDHI